MRLRIVPRLTVVFIVLPTLAIAGCRTLPTGSASGPVAARASVEMPLSLIPAPYRVERSPGHFILRQGARLSVRAKDARATGVARYFADLVQRTRGLHLDLRPAATSADAHAGIVFTIDPFAQIRGDDSAEGYALIVASDRVMVTARTPHGLFNGAVSLWQLLTTDPRAALPIRIPCLRIDDHPRFVWRGLMLDSARHYQSPAFIQRLFDQMALLKLDVFHWHLTDDQGWRLEIKRYPELTRIGAWRTPVGPDVALAGADGRYGGYYTQAEVRDIVRYAAARYITIVPEIEMPGHAQAAIAAYPQLGVTGRRPPVSSDWGVHTWLYNVDDRTFTFLENVLTEVMVLFPGPYIHIGGDEAAKDQWQASQGVQRRMRALGLSGEYALQSWFVSRIERFLAAHGRKLVGWDEILEGGLPPAATVMSWRGTQGAIDAARQGHDVVLSPAPAMYFDHVQSDLPDEPTGRPEVVSLAYVYAFEPVPKQLDAAQARHVLGAQANLWSEYLTTPARVEHAAFPRAAALAEVLWSPAEARDLRGFLERMPSEFARWRQAGIDYADTAFAVRVDAQVMPSAQTAQATLANQSGYGAIRYTRDGSAPTPDSPRYTAPFAVPLPTTLRAAAFAGGRELAAPRRATIDRLFLLRRNSSELKSCKGTLPLRLEDGAASAGTVFQVDIMDPCWIWPRAPLDGIARIAVRVGTVPWNFQLWHDADKVVIHPAVTPGGELQIRTDACTGQTLASIPLAPVPDSRGLDVLTARIPAQAGIHDLCLYFTGKLHAPLRVIDQVQLLPAASL